MKRILFIQLTVCFAMTVFGQADIAIIPQPVSIEKRGGSFELNNFTRIEIPERAPEVQQVARWLAQHLLKVTGYPMGIQPSSAARDSRGTVISFGLNRKEDPSLGDEGYKLETGPGLAILSANKPAGLFYAAQTFLQLFPKEIESKMPVKKSYWEAPAVRITDYPRFSWRGLLLDVSRHFFTKEEVKQFIDEMVRYKYNLLHFHLTDDQGWRIEIKSYPKLTEVGAWNVKKVGSFGRFSPPEPNEPRNYGGFYTQEDIKEIVQYAQDRFVNVMPEIDVPGHSLAAIASYPDLSCTPGTYKVNSGERLMNWANGGFTAIIDNTLCPANEKVYTFLDKVFGEVAQLFPFGYIHMGGDECAKNFWQTNDQIRQLMDREKLKDMHEVQSYFVKRVAKIIESKGKKMIGWDEILEGGLAPNAAVMSWRGIKGGIEAAKLGHEVVMTPNSFVYIDLMQGDAIVEPPVYSSVRLNKSYQFEPVPDGVDAKFIKGGQANLWTEQIYNMRHAQYMTWPRAFAVVEALWSQKEKRNWSDFVKRVEKHFDRYDAAEIKYARSMFDPIFASYKKGKDSITVDLSTEVEGLDIHYSFDNSFPDRFYPKYSGTLDVPKDAVNLRVITYRNDKPIGQMITMPIEELKKRAKSR